LSTAYASRIQAFRNDVIKILPRAPNDRHSLESLQALPTHRLILAFVTWRVRLIRAKPRVVRIWSGGVTPLQFQLAKPKLRPLLEKAAAGRDLTPHVSDLVHKKGIILPGARPSDRRQDIDMVLTREGLHHFHVGVTGSGNPKGRSGSLVFAEVLENEFRIVALSNHSVFDVKSAERRRFFGISQAYMAKDVPPGQGFIGNPVMSSGHSLRDAAARFITDPDAGPLFADKADEADLASGTIYVLRSQSNHPVVAANRTVLHKIGVTSGNVATRIANASLDPTFLMADVDVVATYELYNINRTKLENLIHRVFDPARVDIVIQDRFGNPVVPREWFLVPIFVVDEAVERIKNGTITEYVYDPKAARLVQASDARLYRS